MTHAIDLKGDKYVCKCGKEFPDATNVEVIAAAAKHVDDENFDEHNEQKEKEAAEIKAVTGGAKAESVNDEKTKAAPEQEPESEVKEESQPQPPAENEIKLSETSLLAMAKAGKPITTKAYLTSDEVQARVKDLLKDRAGSFTTSLMAALNATAHLAECKPETVLTAAITAASLQLPINGNLGFAYLIPYYNKKIQAYEAQFQMGYKGFIQLAQRTSLYKTIAATPVYEGQLISTNPLTGNTYDWKAKKSDQVIGYAALIALLNGFEKELYMTVEELTAHGKQYSQSYRSGYGLWNDDFDAMATKTVLKLLISKFGPMTVEMNEAIAKDQSVIVDDQPEYIDNTSELQDRVDTAGTTEELREIFATLTGTEKMIAKPMVDARAELLLEAA